MIPMRSSDWLSTITDLAGLEAYCRLRMAAVPVVALVPILGKTADRDARCLLNRADMRDRWRIDADGIWFSNRRLI
jgi:hypothetical protein